MEKCLNIRATPAAMGRVPTAQIPALEKGAGVLVIFYGHEPLGLSRNRF